MDTVFALALVAGTALTITVLWFPPSWLDQVADAVGRGTSADDGERLGDRLGQGAAPPVDWELLTRTSMLRRLDALAEELERLDRDPDVFAKAFHLMVLRSARDALLSDVARFADPAPRCASALLDVELAAPSTGKREVLEL
jgi:hypothetical protein